MSIYDSSKPMMTLIQTMPDKEWMEKTVTPVFEIPGEIHRKIMDAQTPMAKRREYAAYVYNKYALPCIEQAASHPKLAGFEVLTDEYPTNMRPSDIQEDPEDMIQRTQVSSHKDVPREKRIRAMLRDTVFWQIDIRVKQQRLMYEVNLDPKGPADGYEAIEDLPEALRANIEES